MYLWFTQIAMILFIVPSPSTIKIINKKKISNNKRINQAGGKHGTSKSAKETNEKCS